MLDSGPDGKDPLTVYVLLYPDDTRPKVFQKFASSEMVSWVSDLPRGSDVQYAANGFLASVPRAQVDTLKARCEKKGVTFTESNVN